MADEKVYVKSAFPKQKDGGFKIAIHERDAMHATDEVSDEFPSGNPDGELFIADDAVHHVAVTAGVKAALNDGRLIETNKSGKAKNEPEDEEQVAPTAPNAGAGKPSTGGQGGGR